jgi:methylmalonyl-CoA/ethylmalonyl-CoA epimerase
MPKINKIHHVALVVEEIDDALGFWQGCLGIPLQHISEAPLEKSRIAFLPVGDSEIELVQPTSEDTGVARYLSKRGPGMHHICLEVDDIQGMVDILLGKGTQLIQDAPVLGEDGRKYVFIHPKSANGVLVELYELPRGIEQPE